MARFLLLDILLAAGLPLALALALGFATRQHTDVYEFLGDGQLCLYASSVAVAALWDIAATDHTPAISWLAKGLGYASLGPMLLLSVVVWVGAVNDRERVGEARKQASKFSTFASLVVAVITALLAGLFRYSWGLI